MSERIWVQFSDLKEDNQRNIRRWSTAPFDGGIEYRAVTPTPTGKHQLSHDELQALKYISKQDHLIWYGIYERGGHGDPSVTRLDALGLIEGVPHNFKVGRQTFSGGYRITEAGRTELRERKS